MNLKTRKANVCKKPQCGYFFQNELAQPLYLKIDLKMFFFFFLKYSKIDA